jgi:hypothetical protein
VRADSRDKKGERSLVEWIKARGSIDTPGKVLKNELELAGTRDEGKG